MENDESRYELIMLGLIETGERFISRRRVYSPDGLSPTVLAGGADTFSPRSSWKEAT